MPIYSNKIGGLSGEISNPTEGMSGYNSKGQRVIYDARADKWVMPQNYVAPGESQPQQPVITGGPNGQGGGQGDAERAQEVIQQFADLGFTVTWENGRYSWTNPITGYKEIADSPWGDGGMWQTAREAAGLAPTTNNPWYEGDDPNDDIPGPLNTSPEYPDGGPIPGGNGYLPFMPTDPTGGPPDIGNNPFQPGPGGGNQILPGGGTPGGGSMFDGYGPPEGVPLNPIVKQNEMVFSPYGQGASRFSDTLTYGGLPRSTGPWGVMGGYYGGFPENYANPPEGYNPPNPNNWGNSPGNISPGGNLPTTPIPGSALPPNPWSPAKPIEWNNGGEGTGTEADPNLQGMTPEQQAAYTYFQNAGLKGGNVGGGGQLP